MHLSSTTSSSRRNKNKNNKGRLLSSNERNSSNNAMNNNEGDVCKPAVLYTTDNERRDILDSKDHLKMWNYSATHCARCGLSNSDIDGMLLQCGKCKKAYYCSKRCFNDDLMVHMEFCKTTKIQRGPKKGPGYYKHRRQEEPEKEPVKEPVEPYNMGSRSKPSEDPVEDDDKKDEEPAEETPPENDDNDDNKDESVPKDEKEEEEEEPGPTEPEKEEAPVENVQNDEDDEESIVEIAELEDDDEESDDEDEDGRRRRGQNIDKVLHGSLLRPPPPDLNGSFFRLKVGDGIVPEGGYQTECVELREAETIRREINPYVPDWVLNSPLKSNRNRNRQQQQNTKQYHSVSSGLNSNSPLGSGKESVNNSPNTTTTLKETETNGNANNNTDSNVPEWVKNRRLRRASALPSPSSKKTSPTNSTEPEFARRRNKLRSSISGTNSPSTMANIPSLL